LLLFPPLSLVFSSIPPPPPALPPFSLHDALPISGRLPAVVPGGGWRLRDAALRRRALHRHDRGLHRAAVLAPLRLADGQRHVVLGARRLPARRAAGGRPPLLGRPARTRALGAPVLRRFGVCVGLGIVA